MSFILVLTALLAFVPHPAAAQSALATLTGVVVDQTGAPIPQAGLEVAPGAGVAPHLSTADTEGRFMLAALPPGRYTVVARHPGFADASLDDVVLTQGQPTAIRIEMKVAGLSELVSVPGVAALQSATPSTIEVSPLEVRAVAGAGENIFRVLQTLPGVTAVNDFDSRLSVRGGGPDQNLTLMDGVEIHNPYRLFGLTSAFNPETVESFSLNAGGFSAKYGDRLSSLLLIDTRDGTTAASIAGTAAISITDANIVTEGRIPGSSNSSWLLTARRTYYDLAAERVVGSKLPWFGDLQGRVAWELSPGRRFTFFGTRSREGADAAFNGNNDGDKASLKSATSNDLAAVSFASPLGTRATTKTTVSWYRNNEDIDFDGTFRDEARRSNRPEDDAVPFASILFTRGVLVKDIAVREELAMKAANAHFLEGGFETHAIDTAWGWTINGDRNPNEANGSSAQGGASLPSFLDSSASPMRAGAWLTDRWTLTPRLRVEPGVRVDWSGLAGEVIASPRLALAADISRRTRLRLAGGLFTQSPGYEKLLQSDYFVDLSSGGAQGLKSERAWHAVASLEHDLKPGVTTRVESYYKTFDHLLIGRLETPAEVAARVATYDYPAELQAQIPRAREVTSYPENTGTGRAYGVEFYAAKQAMSATTHLSGWMSYTWGRAENTAYGRTYRADYDRTHALSIVSNYQMSRLVQVGITMRAQSGFPQSPAIGVRVEPVADSHDADGDGNRTELIPFRDSQGLLVWTPDFGTTATLNSGALPFFARVDLRTTFRPRWSNHRWQLYVEVINLLNRDNASSLDTVLVYDPSSDRPGITTKRSGRIPLLPSFGVRYRF